MTNTRQKYHTDQQQIPEKYDEYLRNGRYSQIICSANINCPSQPITQNPGFEIWNPNWKHYSIPGNAYPMQSENDKWNKAKPIFLLSVAILQQANSMTPTNFLYFSAQQRPAQQVKCFIRISKTHQEIPLIPEF